MYTSTGKLDKQETKQNRNYLSCFFDRIPLCSAYREEVILGEEKFTLQLMVTSPFPIFGFPPVLRTGK